MCEVETVFQCGYRSEHARPCQVGYRTRLLSVALPALCLWVLHWGAHTPWGLLCICKFIVEWVWIKACTCDCRAWDTRSCVSDTSWEKAFGFTALIGIIDPCKSCPYGACVHYVALDIINVLFNLLLKHKMIILMWVFQCVSCISKEIEIQEFRFVMASSSSPVKDHLFHVWIPLLLSLCVCYAELKFLFLMYFLSPPFPGEAGATEGTPCGLQSCHSPLASPTSLLQT